MGNEKPPADRGKQEKDKTEQKCTVCHGSGKLKKSENNYVDCKRGDGTGWVLK